tara:strand:+ start:5016 stop:5348 length:333 start_codon:yes stop_codon:yes gene_type:complete
MKNTKKATFNIGQIVKHKYYPFRGVVFDIDPEYSNTEEYLMSIPKKIRPVKDQPFYHLLAENSETEYIAYVSEQNLIPDESDEPISHDELYNIFGEFRNGSYKLLNDLKH